MLELKKPFPEAKTATCKHSFRLTWGKKRHLVNTVKQSLKEQGQQVRGTSSACTFFAWCKRQVRRAGACQACKSLGCKSKSYSGVNCVPFTFSTGKTKFPAGEEEEDQSPGQSKGSAVMPVWTASAPSSAARLVAGPGQIRAAGGREILDHLLLLPLDELPSREAQHTAAQRRRQSSHFKAGQEPDRPPHDSPQEGAGHRKSSQLVGGSLEKREGQKRGSLEEHPQTISPSARLQRLGRNWEMREEISGWSPPNAGTKRTENRGVSNCSYRPATPFDSEES